MEIVEDKQIEVQQYCLPYPVKQAKIMNWTQSGACFVTHLATANVLGIVHFTLL